jgi:hypothetical protein
VAAVPTLNALSLAWHPSELSMRNQLCEHADAAERTEPLPPELAAEIQTR